MWPFKKKDDLNLDTLEKELNIGSSSGHDSLGIPTSQAPQQNFDSEEDDGGFAKTTKQERNNMAKSFSNSEDEIVMPSSHVPVGNIGTSRDYGNYNANYAGNDFDQESSFRNSGSSASLGLDKNTHKMEIMEKQIEILSSKVDLLKANLDAINSKLSVIDQKIDKKLSSW